MLILKSNRTISGRHLSSDTVKKITVENWLSIRESFRHSFKTERFEKGLEAEILFELNNGYLLYSPSINMVHEWGFDSFSSAWVNPIAKGHPLTKIFK